MAGPYNHHPHRPYDAHLDEQDAAAHALRHFDSQHDHGLDEVDANSETAPFYSHHNSSYYNNTTHHSNDSESSLPLYRSRSQSLSMAQAAAARDENNNSSSAYKIPAMPQQAATTPSVRAVDYTQTDSADNLRRAQPPSTAAAAAARPMPERVNTLQSSTNTSSNNNHNDTSQSTTWSSNANTLTNSQTSPPTSATPPPHHEKKRMAWADEVAKVFDPSTGKATAYHDEKTEQLNGGNNKGSAISRSASPLSTAPGMARRWTETDLDDENGFDDYDWDDDDDLVKQLDEKYEEEYKKANAPEDRRRRTVIRRFSPVHLAKLLLFTFLGNVVLILLLITPALVVQFLVKGQTQDQHLQFVCDNIEAWCYWIAFNFIAKWIIHSLFDLIPKLFVFVVEMIWGDLNEKFIGYVELFNASAPYFKVSFIILKH